MVTRIAGKNEVKFQKNTEYLIMIHGGRGFRETYCPRTAMLWGGSGVVIVIETQVNPLCARVTEGLETLSGFKCCIEPDSCSGLVLVGWGEPQALEFSPGTFPAVLQGIIPCDLD